MPPREKNVSNASDSVTKSTDPEVENKNPNPAVEEDKKPEVNAETKQGEQADEKDAKITDLEKQLEASKSENKELKNQLKTKDQNINELSEKLVSSASANSAAEENKENLAVANVAGNTVKMVKIQFLKDHEFVVGNSKIRGIKGNGTKVDIATANKLAARGIAILVN